MQCMKLLNATKLICICYLQTPELKFPDKQGAANEPATKVFDPREGCFFYMYSRLKGSSF